MWTNKIFLITTWWILDFSSLPVMLWTSWIFKRFWIWKPWFGAVEENVDLLVKQEQAPVITHPFCSLKITESWEKKISSCHLTNLRNLENLYVRVDNKNYSHLLHGQHLDGWFEHISALTTQKALPPHAACHDLTEMYLYLLLPTEITEIMDRPQPRLFGQGRKTTPVNSHLPQQLV